MKKRTVRIYNVIAFVVLPVVIVLASILVALFIKNELTATVDKDEVTEGTQTGELYEVLFVEENNDIYVIYAIDDFYKLSGENELIAFHGFDEEEISDRIWGCDHGAYAISYWQGEGRSIDFSVTGDCMEYLEELQENTYAEGKEPDFAHIADEFSHVTMYELEDYLGYEHVYNNGIGIAVIFVFGAIGYAALIALMLELLIAIILRFTVFKVKRE